LRLKGQIYLLLNSKQQMTKLENRLLLDTYKIHFPVSYKRSPQDAKINIVIPPYKHLNQALPLKNSNQLAFRTGECNRVTVVDIDGELAMMEFVKQFGEVDTLGCTVVETESLFGRKGLHLYFDYTPALGGTSAGKWMKDVDVRNDGGIIFYDLVNGEKQLVKFVEKSPQVPKAILDFSKNNVIKKEKKRKTNVVPEDDKVLENIESQDKSDILNSQMKKSFLGEWFSTVQLRLGNGDRFDTATTNCPNKNHNSNHQYIHVNEKTIVVSCHGCDEKWVVNIVDDVTKLGEKYSGEHTLRFFEKDPKPFGGMRIKLGKTREFLEYMNCFACVFDRPMSYGFKNYPNDTDYVLCSKTALSERMGKMQVSFWNGMDDKTNFKRRDFIVDARYDTDETVFNTYVRPPMSAMSTQLEDFVTEFPLVYTYLHDVISAGDENVFAYILDYISVVIQRGFTGIGVVLMGKKGSGKSFFPHFMSILAGDDYYATSNSLDDLVGHFNARFERCIIASLEEVVGNGGDYHKAQNIIKDLVKNKKRTITHKGVNSYTVVSSTNYILSTNNENPVHVTADERSFLLLDVSNVKRCDTDFFGSLNDQIMDFVEKLRYFFYHRETDYRLERNRPKTLAEKRLVSLNITIEQRFADETKIVKEMTLKDIYVKFKNFSESCGEKNLKPRKYFQAGMEAIGYQFTPRESTHNPVKVMGTPTAEFSLV